MLETRKRNTCKVCGIVAKDRSKLKRHLKGKHNIGDDNFQCKACNKTFASSDRLKEHKRGVHLKKKDHGCEKCNKEISRPWQLKKHKCTSEEPVEGESSKE